MKPKVFFPNLDGLRFFCFLAVFLFHSFHTEYEYIKSDSLYQFVAFDLFGNGNLGVNFFFVLSGFLITYLLLTEIQLHGRINIGNFYIRRALRIWPLFYFCVAFGFIAFPFFKEIMGEVPTETANLVYYLFFINNFDFIKNPPDSSVLSVLWSVAIEEQFYLFWPLLLWIIPSRFTPLVFIAIIAQSIIFRLFNFDPMLLEYHTLSCISDMAIGGLGAYTVLTFSSVVDTLKKINKGWIIVLYIVTILLLLFRAEFLQRNYILAAVERVFVALIFLFIILEQNYAENSLFKLSNFNWISLMGKRTYGLYCLHFIGILVVTKTTKMLGINTHLWQVLVLDTVLAFALTLFIAEISYRFYELPFLRIKEKFSSITSK